VGGFDSLLSLDNKINTLEDAMGVIFKLKNGLANVLSENRKYEAEIDFLKNRIQNLT
jgi:regulator of replication initiation timing